MIEISSSTYIDPRTGLTMLRLTMKKDGHVSSVETDYRNLMKKTDAEAELCSMISTLCGNVYQTAEEILSTNKARKI